MKDIIPWQTFKVVVQAAAGGMVITRGKIHPLRKNVTAKCYGGGCHQKEQIATEAARWEKEDEACGQGGSPSGGLLDPLAGQIKRRY